MPFSMRLIALGAVVSLAAQPVGAQRFEGVITFKVNSLAAAVTGGRAGARANAGRGEAARGSAASGATGRAGTGAAGAGAGAGAGAAGAAGAARGSSGSEARSAQGRATMGRASVSAADAGLTDAQAEAMRSALAGGLDNIEYMTRRGRVRIAISGGRGGQSPAAMIYAPEDGLMFTLIPAVSMYSETALADLVALAPDAATTSVPARAAPRPPVVTHTKRFEQIAGHRCEHVLIEYAKLQTDVCMGKGLGVFIMPAVLGQADGWTQVMTESNGFPLRVTQPDGRVMLEVTKIERKPLAESLFTVPETYTRMPDLLRRPPG